MSKQPVLREIDLRGNTVYQFDCTYEQRMTAKEGGMMWFSREYPRFWGTYKPEIAYRFRNFASPELAARLESIVVGKLESIQDSWASDADIEIPLSPVAANLGYDYLPYQRAGVAFALNRDNTLIGDDMGLGKSIQAIGVLNSDPRIKSALFIVPNMTKLGWRDFLRDWLVPDLSYAVTRSGKPFPATDIVVVNYDAVKKFHGEIRAREWGMVVIDEGQYMKSRDSQRSIYVVGGEEKIKKNEVEAYREQGIQVNKVSYTYRGSVKIKYMAQITPVKGVFRNLILTGTPAVNRPVELWPLISYLDSQNWPNFWSFAKRYCAAYKSQYGWKTSGASHTEELSERLRSTIMVRRLKDDVLKELPPKFHKVVPIEANGDADLLDEERRAFDPFSQRFDFDALEEAVKKAKASDDPRDLEDAMTALEEALKIAFQEMSAIRHDTGLAKIPYIIEHVRGLVEAGHKVLVFNHHRDVVDAIYEAFPNSARIYGGMTLEDRKTEENRFQSDPECTVCSGNYAGAGVGITLTAASWVVLGELDWVPGNITQAIDRAHRYGQTAKSLPIDYLVFENSIDARMANFVIEKQKVLKSIFDEKYDVDVTAIVDVKEQVRKTKAVELIEEKKDEDRIPDEVVSFIHGCIRSLAGRCDYARQEDGMGFNRFDAVFGHSLADQVSLSQKQVRAAIPMVNKYRGQFNEETRERIKEVFQQFGKKKVKS